MKLSEIPGINFPESDLFTLFAGPCVVESIDSLGRIAEKLCEISVGLKIPFVLKASYKKANRTKHDAFRGIGDEKALKALRQVGTIYKIPTMTDVHSIYETRLAEQYVDILQIPAFLCRQTELIEAAALTGKIVNIKKGQFISAEDMIFIAEKIQNMGNDNIIFTERGTMFGSDDTVLDFRNIEIMKDTGHPVLVDVTHSLGKYGGIHSMIKTFAKCAIVAGADGIFIETHPNPVNAKSDGSRMLMLNNMPELLRVLISLKQVMNVTK